MVGKTLLIRADADAEIGVGHVMRCIAIAEAWRRDGGQVIFALATGVEETEAHIRGCKCDIVRLDCQADTDLDTKLVSQLRIKCGAEWVVLDGYHFSAKYIDRLKSDPMHLLAINDAKQFVDMKCDIVVNPEPGVAEAEYRSAGFQGELLLGSSYALIREEFLRHRIENRTVPEVAGRILITLGGGDPQNVTLEVLRSLDEITDRKLDLSVVVGPANSSRASLEEAARHSPHSVTLVENSDKMAELMLHCDLAVAAGGGTSSELAFMQVPMFLIAVAKNQERAIQALVKARAAASGGWFQSLDRTPLAESLRQMIDDCALRQELATNAGKLIDGRGAKRVVARMVAHSESMSDVVGPPTR